MGTQIGQMGVSEASEASEASGTFGRLRSEVLKVIDELQSKINLFQDIPELLFSDFVPKLATSPAFNEDQFPAVDSVKRPASPLSDSNYQSDSNSDYDFY